MKDLSDKILLYKLVEAGHLLKEYARMQSDASFIGKLSFDESQIYIKNALKNAAIEFQSIEKEILSRMQKSERSDKG